MDLDSLLPALHPLQLEEEELLDLAGGRMAAVSILLRTGANRKTQLDVLLMRRANRPGDRWSGQIGLPGGHAEPIDEHLLATAVRETREEVGVDLKKTASVLGRLEPIRAKAKGKLIPMWIVPFVFRATEPIQPHLGPEAAEAFWLPLDQARAGHLDSSHTYRAPQANFHMPAWKFEERIVWGLTYEILSGLNRLFDRLERNEEAP